jgi:hypothetical protein
MLLSKLGDVAILVRVSQTTFSAALKSQSLARTWMWLILDPRPPFMCPNSTASIHLALLLAFDEGVSACGEQHSTSPTIYYVFLLPEFRFLPDH